MSEKCELYDRVCTECGECDMCDLDPDKHCDDCGKCIDDSEDYRSVTIEDFIRQNVTKEQINRALKKLEEKEKKDINE